MTKTRRNLTFRPYYTLLIRDQISDYWQIHFGDYDQAVVDTERDDMHESGYLKQNMRIIRTEAKQRAIDKAVEQLNATNKTIRQQIEAAPFDPPFRIIGMTFDNVIDVHNAIADAVGEPELKLKPDDKP